MREAKRDKGSGGVLRVGEPRGRAPPRWEARVAAAGDDKFLVELRLLYVAMNDILLLPSPPDSEERPQL